MSRGFTIIEVTVAVFVIAVAAAAIFGLVGQSISSSASLSSQLLATSLSQEGIEIVRNIRDSNFLKIQQGLGGTWVDGLTPCSSGTAGCEADYTATGLVAQDRFLNVSNGMYSYNSGIPTLFKRKIFVTQSGTDRVDVLVQVTWQEKGVSHAVSGATTLYNWLTPSP